MNKHEAQNLIESLKTADGRFKISDLWVLTEYKGKPGEDYPDIPTSPDVDIEMLTAGDDSPFYTTLKIGHAEMGSRNYMYYDSEFAQEVARLVNTRRPTGGNGHIKNGDESSALPLNEMTWVGAKLQGEFAWGKAYVAPGPVRDYIRRRGAARAEVATSIYGYIDEVEWDSEHEMFRPVLHDLDEGGNRGLTLEYIDLATPERAGVPSLATVPKMTNEMSHSGQTPDNPNNTENENMPTKAEILNELTSADIKNLPGSIVAEIHGTAPAVETLSSVRELLGVDESGDVVAAVKELAASVATQNAALIESHIELKASEIKVPDSRAAVIDLVRDAQPATVEKATEAFESVMAREYIKKMIQREVVEIMGPAHARGNEGETDTSEFLVKPEPAE